MERKPETNESFRHPSSKDRKGQNQDIERPLGGERSDVGRERESARESGRKGGGSRSQPSQSPRPSRSSGSEEF